jgi:DNA-directed RNA polymerase specialized sigma subunit
MNFNEYKKKALENDPDLLKEYKALEPEYEIIRQIIAARNEKNLTQRELAERCGMKQSNISRLEFLKKVASGLDKELHIEFRDR